MMQRQTMKAENKFNRRDWVTAAVFFLVALTLYVPFRGAYAYHWDSGEFAMAVREYNVALSQPHAPGFILYIMTGRLLNLLIGDPHASLVWLSVLCGSALVSVLYLLGATMFGRRTGIVAALLGMTSPQLWFYSCVALTYIVDGFLVSFVVLYCWRAMQRGGTWMDAVVIGGLLAVVGGVRQQTVPALVPLVVWLFWRFERPRLAKLAVAAVVSLVLEMMWFVPMVRLSGGLAVYLEILRRYAVQRASMTWVGGGWDALLWNVFFTGVFCVDGLMLGVPVLAAALLYRVSGPSAQRNKEVWDKENGLALHTTLLWVVPAAIMGIAVSFTRLPGYILNFLPGLLLLTAVAITSLRTRFGRIMVTTVVCVFNSFTFLAWPAGWDGVFFGMGRTAREIRDHDQTMSKTVRIIRERFSPGDVVICHAIEYMPFGMRQFQVHLLEFDQYLMLWDKAMITPSDRPMISIQEGRLGFVAGLDTAAKRTIILIVPPGRQLSEFGLYCDVDRATLLPDSNGIIYTLDPKWLFPSARDPHPSGS
jgi:Dolichyl-phosphate-mannose-protein mannosyltransferase